MPPTIRIKGKEEVPGLPKEARRPSRPLPSPKGTLEDYPEKNRYQGPPQAPWPERAIGQGLEYARRGSEAFTNAVAGPPGSGPMSDAARLLMSLINPIPTDRPMNNWDIGMLAGGAAIPGITKYVGGKRGFSHLDALPDVPGGPGSIPNPMPPSYIPATNRELGLPHRPEGPNFSTRGFGSSENVQKETETGFNRQMSPQEFRRLNPERPSDPENMAAIRGRMKSGEEVGKPALYVGWNNDKQQWQVYGHEGRGRTLNAEARGEKEVPVSMVVDKQWRKGLREHPERADAPIRADWTAPDPSFIQHGKAGYPDITDKFTNPDARRTIDAYQNAASVKDVENYFNASLFRDARGKTTFENIWEHEVQVRVNKLDRTSSGGNLSKPYLEKEQNVNAGKSASGNVKTGIVEEGGILALDTSRGCAGGMCSECYVVYGGVQQKNTEFLRPRAITLKGDARQNLNTLRRIGESGEPNLDPRAFGDQVEPVLIPRVKAAPIDIAGVDKIMEPAYDWSYTVEQMKNVHMDDPAVAANTFVITKLHSLKNFDPTVLRNIEVSVDTTNPTHFFKTLKNVEELQRLHPDVNVGLRIRSLSTYSDEINTLQKLGVDFANKHNLPVLETRLRIKTTGPLKETLQKDYYASSFQLKHKSMARGGKGTEEPTAYDTSPLSQLGLRKDLHKICNEHGAEIAACAGCKNCKMFMQGVKTQNPAPVEAAPAAGAAAPVPKTKPPKQPATYYKGPSSMPAGQRFDQPEPFVPAKDVPDYRETTKHAPTRVRREWDRQEQAKRSEQFADINERNKKPKKK